MMQMLQGDGYVLSVIMQSFMERSSTPSTSVIMQSFIKMSCVILYGNVSFAKIFLVVNHLLKISFVVEDVLRMLFSQIEKLSSLKLLGLKMYSVKTTMKIPL